MIIPVWWHLASSMSDRQTRGWGKCQTLTSWPAVMLLEKELEQWLRRFCFSPSGDSVGLVNTLTGGKTERREAAEGGGVTGEVIFHTGDSHFRLGLESSAAESELRRSQQCASSGTIRVCHTLVPEPWTDPNITWTLWRCRVLHLSKPFQLSVDTENSLTGISSGKWKLSKSFPGWLTYCRSLDAILLFLFVSNISKTFFVPTQVFM